MVTKSIKKVKSSTSSASTPKKAKMSKALKPEEKSGHPKTSDMVNTAIKDLGDRSGSSLISIKKYIAQKYGLVSEKKTAYYIRKYLNKAVADGTLVQTKGKGANGSFKMPSAAVLATQRREAKVVKAPSKTEKPKKPAAVKKPSTTQETSRVKKPVSAKTVEKSTDNGKSKPAKSAAAKTPSKSPKAKKITKTPTSKPKAPRPKKVIPASKTSKPAAKKVLAKKTK